MLRVLSTLHYNITAGEKMLDVDARTCYEASSVSFSLDICVTDSCTVYSNFWMCLLV